MAKANKNSQFIKKEEIKFWLAIILMAVSGAVAFTKLEARVKATEKEELEFAETVGKMLDHQQQIFIEIGEIKKDIQYIKENSW